MEILHDEHGWPVAHEGADGPHGQPEQGVRGVPLGRHVRVLGEPAEGVARYG